MLEKKWVFLDENVSEAQAEAYSTADLLMRQMPRNSSTKTQTLSIHPACCVIWIKQLKESTRQSRKRKKLLYTVTMTLTA